MRHFKLKVLMAMGVAMAFSSAHAEIISVKTMKSVQARVEAALEIHKAEDVWVAFDIDMTLIQPDHPAVCYPAIKKYWGIFRSVLENLSLQQRDIVNTLIVQTIPQRLVEEGTPRIVGDLQEKGVRIIAFTATLTGNISTSREKTIFLRKDSFKNRGWILQGASVIFPHAPLLRSFPNMLGRTPCLIMAFSLPTASIRSARDKRLSPF